MKWSIDKAKAWMYETGMNHIRDGLFTEGGELIYEAKFSDGCHTEDAFRDAIALICGWEPDDIDEAVMSAMQ